MAGVAYHTEIALKHRQIHGRRKVDRLYANLAVAHQKDIPYIGGIPEESRTATPKAPALINYPSLDGALRIIKAFGVCELPHQAILSSLPWGRCVSTYWPEIFKRALYV